MIGALAGVLAGLVFGLGLGLSAAANPRVIMAFLDLAGARFDPTLGILFGAAVVTGVPAFRIVLRRTRPVADASFHLPTSTAIDRPLVVGAVVFGFGWALSGFCIGPALVCLVASPAKALLYIGATALGIVVHDLTTRRPA